MIYFLITQVQHSIHIFGKHEAQSQQLGWEYLHNLAGLQISGNMYGQMYCLDIETI